MIQAENTLGAFLVNSFGDRYLHAVNRTAFNAIGSDALYASLYGDKLFTEYQFNLIVGTDSGIFLKFVLKNGVPTGSRYLFVELPEVLDLLSREHLLEDLPSDICVTTLDSWSVLAKSLQFTEYVFLDSVNLQGSLASTDAHLPGYRDVSWQLNLEFKTAIHNIYTGMNCTYFILRQLENLAENQVRFAHTMVGAFSGRTAIILAGGPSLKDALPWVRENRDRVVVIAASRISRILLDEGIVPHVIVTVDPQQISFEVSREMLRFADEAEPPLLVASYHASPLLVGQWRGKNVYSGNLFPWKTAFNDDPLRYLGPTVGNYGISIAMHLGFEKIILAGVDLCFSAQGQTHAAGSNENKVGPDLGQVSPRIETYGGWHADTNQGYAEALDVLRVQAALGIERGQRIYNCSLGAAKVPLVELTLLDDLNIPACIVTPAALIDSLVPEPSAKARLTHYRLVKKELLRVRRKFQEILNLSREALDCADGLFRGDGKDRDFKYKIRMDKIERKLDQRYPDFSSMVKHFGIRKFLALLKTPKRSEDWSDEQVEAETRNYYQAYLEGSEDLIGMVDGTLRRIDSRIEEEKEKPDFDMLFSQWEKDGQYGRLSVWQHRHGCKSLASSEAGRDQTEHFEGEFLRIMTEERTSQMVLLEKGHDVKHTRSKALLLYQRKEIAELEAMAQGLACHPSPEKALPYLHFVNGLVAELQGNKDTAAACYQDLLTEDSQLTEDALQQIATMALSSSDIESALLALDCLAGLSEAYLPPYADLLKAVGRFEDAFNCYNRYVGLVPDDSAAVMRLGILCTEAGLLDSARELFNRVLERDGNNSAAKILLDELDRGAPSGQLSKEKATDLHTLGSKGGKPDTVLLFKGSSQYDVTRYFLTDISEAFNALGYATTVIDLLEQGWHEDFLNAISRHNIMFFFSINGVGNDFLESLQKVGGCPTAPIFNFYVDHPCYHVARISCHLSKLLISCVDSTHIDFINEYPYLKETSSKVFIPHGCSIRPGVKCKSISDRSIDILFAGSFSDPEDIRKQWSSTELGWLLDDIAENALFESYRPITTIFRELFELNKIKVDALRLENISPLLQVVDLYVRAKRRKQILDNFSSLNIQVYGEGWDKFQPTHTNSKISFHEPVDFIGIQNKMADSKIVLNILPCFVEGAHERVFTAMLAGAVCLSDENSYLSSNFKNEENILLFNLKNEGGSERIAHFLNNPDLLQEMSAKGKQIALEKHTWLNRAEQILQAVADCNS